MTEPHKVASLESFFRKSSERNHKISPDYHKIFK